MKISITIIAAIALVSCDQRDAAVSTLDPAPVLRENAELKKKVADLEKHNSELTDQLFEALEGRSQDAAAALSRAIKEPSSSEAGAAKAPN